MSKRPAISVGMKINALLHLAKGEIWCPVCVNRIEAEQDIDWDHAWALALGGKHHYGNLRPVHRSCHRIKSSGTKATSAGSDIHKIAKVKRIVKSEKFVVNRSVSRIFSDALRRSAKLVHKAKRKWPSRPMQSRPF